MTHPNEARERYLDPEPEPSWEEVCPDCDGQGGIGHWCPNPDCIEGVVGVYVADFEDAWDD